WARCWRERSPAAARRTRSRSTSPAGSPSRTWPRRASSTTVPASTVSGSTSSSDVDVAGVRAELAVLDGIAFLNTGTFGPLPRRTLDAMAAADRLDFERGRTGAWYPEEILELRESVRSALAGVIGVPPQTVALT